MNNNTLFCHLSSTRIAEMIKNAKHSVCYAGPGITISKESGECLASKFGYYAGRQIPGVASLIRTNSQRLH
jgi:hypothetical protein